MGIRSLLRGGVTESTPENGRVERVGSRRNLFKLLGIGAAGAVGASVLEASPAGATTVPNLKVNGVASFVRSGVVTVADNGVTTVKVPGGLSASSHVLATMNAVADGGQGVLHVWAAVPDTQTGTITLYSYAFKGAKIAWFVFG